MSPEEAAVFVKECEKKIANPNEIMRSEEANEKQYVVAQLCNVHYQDYFLFSPKSFQSIT